MELKKNPKYDVNLKIGMLRNLGLTISLFVVILAFELPSNGNRGIIELPSINDRFEEVIEIPPTKQPPPPKPKVQIREIIAIPNEKEIEEEIEIELDVEVIESTIVDEVVFSMREQPNEEVAEEVFTIVEDQPEFPGGIEAFYNLIGEKIRYPAQARRMGIQGRVYVEFIVGKDGSLKDMKVIKGIGAGCDKEAIRVLKLVPNFKPGKQRGKPVLVRMVVPIYFMLADQPQSD